jgi:RNA polymerase sigma-70 factor (ECF subfamily)
MAGDGGDRELARRIVAGDARAFHGFFDHYFPKLYRLALLRVGGNTDDAAEVAQLTFCRAFERMASYRGEASLYSWLCQICRNAIVDLGRDRQRSRPLGIASYSDETVDAILESLAAPAADVPEERVWREQLVALIQTTLDALPEHYGDILEWKYVDGLSVNEIGVRLAIGAKAAESLLTRARGAFRERIVTLGDLGELTPAGLRS